MNQSLEDAVVANILSVFPTANIYTGIVEQGVKPDDIIIKTVAENITTLGEKVTQTDSLFQVSVVNPTTDLNILTRNLYSALLAFNINGDYYYYSDTVNMVNIDGIVHATVSISYQEVNQ